MPKLLQETAAITEAAAAEAKKTGRMQVQFISPGWGSSGYYGPEVLEQAVTDRVIPAGTHMYADHPTETEDYERPVRSIKDLMAVTVEDATLSADGALVGEVQVVPQWRDLVETVKDAIGVSIRGSATDIVEGEAEGRKGGIIEGLVAPVLSVDFVTRAGRGGKVLSVLESAAANRRALGRGIAEATVNDTREQLQTLLRDAYGADKTYVWVRDFDDTTVWFEVESGEDSGVYGQSYANTDGAIALSGERTEVRVSTTYVTVTRPDSNTPTTEADQEVTMGNIQIDEAEHRSIVEKAGRVDALLTENATLKAENTELKESQAADSRVTRAREIIAERGTAENVRFSPLEERGLVASLPVKDDKLDEAAFTATVDTEIKATVEAAAKAAEAAGAGSITGYGNPVAAPTTGITESEFHAGLGIVKEA